jgi:5-methyltetrahydrofolate--homocysteine methyltransferase
MSKIHTQESLRQALAGEELIVGDGAFGTLLQARGLPAGMLPEAWNETHPDAVIEIHRAYVEAGADYVTTNSFGGSRPRLKEGGLGDRTAEINRLSAELARQAVGDRAWVAGSVGPTGRLMEPFGDLSVAEAEEIFAEQVSGLLAGGADLLVIETHHDLEEAGAVLRMARERTDLPIFCTFAFNPKGRTMMGVRAGQAAQRMQELGADAVGANCGDGPAAIAAALEQMREATTLPLVAKANAGIPQLGADGEAVWDVGPEELAEHARQFVTLGARIIGGCCGTNPAYIAAIAAALGSR